MMCGWFRPAGWLEKYLMRSLLIVLLCIAMAGCAGSAPTTHAVSSDADPYPGSGGGFFGTPSGPPTFKPERFAAFQVGVTTKAQVAAALGKPDGWVTRSDGTSQLEYAYAGPNTSHGGLHLQQIVYAFFTFGPSRTLSQMQFPGHDEGQRQPAAAPQPAAAANAAVVPPQTGHSVGCVDISALTSNNTPAEILPGMKQCIDSRDYDRAARLFGVADVYGRFDTLRVQDISAQSVIPALESAYLGQIDKDSAAKIQAALKAISGSSRELARLCTQVRTLGSPTYYPTYMLAHGMSAFTGQSDGLKRDFDRTSAWESALKNVLHCPIA